MFPDLYRKHGVLHQLRQQHDCPSGENQTCHAGHGDALSQKQYSKDSGNSEVHGKYRRHDRDRTAAQGEVVGDDADAECQAGQPDIERGPVRAQRVDSIPRL